MFLDEKAAIFYFSYLIRRNWPGLCPKSVQVLHFQSRKLEITSLATLILTQTTQNVVCFAKQTFAAQKTRKKSAN